MEFMGNSRDKNEIMCYNKASKDCPRAATTAGDVSDQKGLGAMPHYITRTCPMCGADYLADIGRLKHGRQTTCSRECSYKARNFQHQGRLIHCAICDKLTLKYAYEIDKAKHGLLFCSTDCYHLAQRRGLFGANPRRNSDRECLQCGKQFHPDSHRSKYCSRKCFESSHKERMRGENNPSYIDGRSYETTDYRGEDWEVIRKSIYQRDNYTCQRCKCKCIGKAHATSGNTHLIIQCHHITPYSVSHDNRPENLITLCLRCHLIIENGGEW